LPPSSIDIFLIFLKNFIERLTGDLSTVERLMTSSSKRNNNPATVVAGRWNFRQIETPLGADYDHLALASSLLKDLFIFHTSPVTFGFNIFLKNENRKSTEKISGTGRKF
jgi:hypothetical protein